MKKLSLSFLVAFAVALLALPFVQACPKAGEGEGEGE